MPELKPVPPPAPPPTQPAAAPVSPPVREVEKKQAPLPERVVVAQFYAFYDDNNRYREWREGDLIDDPAEIELLVSRKAPLKDSETGKRLVWD